LEPPETATPELELELIEPLDDCTPDDEVLELLVDELDVDEVEADVLPVVEPGIVLAPTTPNTPTRPTAASAAPAVSWLISRSARSRAETLARRFSVLSGMGPSFGRALKRFWEFPESFL
jgi:hypothetical protein